MAPPEHSMQITGNAQGIVQGNNNQVTMILEDGASNIILNLFQADYDPIRHDIEALRLVEAERAIDRLIEKVEQISLKNAALANDEDLLDFHQRLLLAHGNIHALRANTKAAMQCWQQAKSIHPFSPQRKVQAAFLLINLGASDSLDEILASLPYFVPEYEKLQVYRAMYQNDQPAALAQISPDTIDLDLIILRLQMQLALLRYEGIAAFIYSLAEAWDVASHAPLAMLAISELTVELLQKVLQDRPSHDIDRAALIEAIRSRFQAVLSVFALLANSYPEGYGRSLVSNARFYLFLEEEERAQELLDRAPSLPVCRAKALASLLMDEPIVNDADIQSLEEAGALLAGEALLLSAHCHQRQKSPEELEASLHEILVQDSSMYVRQVALSNIVRLKVQRFQFEEADRFLEDERVNLPVELFVSLKCLVIFKASDTLAAVQFLGEELLRLPYSCVLLRDYVRRLLGAVHIKTGKDTGPTDKLINLSADLTEVRQSAQKLATLWPCPEMQVLMACALATCNELDTALGIIQDVEANGYTTRQTVLYHSRFLLALGHPEQAVEVLEPMQAQYPSDYSVSWQLGTAWEADNNHDRAIAVLAPFCDDPRAGIELYVNLGRAYLLSASEKLENANRAFDVFLKAFDRFPLEPQLPVLLMQAGEAAGRGREAWQLIGRMDLNGNPYIQSFTTEEALPLIMHQSQRLQSVHTLYLAGMLPYAKLTAESPRPAWFLRLAAMKQFEQAWDASQTPPQGLVVAWPLSTLPLASKQRPYRKVLVEQTSLLTWGVLGILDEMLASLNGAGWRVYLFPGCMAFLDAELTRIEGSHSILTSNLPNKIIQLLLTGNANCEIRRHSSPDLTPPTDEQFRSFGPRAFDLTEAIQDNAYYLDDYANPDAPIVASEIRCTSAEILGALISRGLVSISEGARVRSEFPEIFSEPTEAKQTDIARPIVLSAQAALAWYQTGLLERWANGPSEWPRLILGPAAWTELLGMQTEARLYREALSQCKQTRTLLKAALKSKKVYESPSVPRLGIKLGELGALWHPALEVLSVANHHQMAVCADDGFYHIIFQQRPLASRAEYLRPLEARVRKRFPRVQLLTTEHLLQRLIDQGALSLLRAGELTWCMYRYGYRGLDLDGVLLWLLHQTPYADEPLPIPYARLFEDLKHIDTWFPPELLGALQQKFVRAVEGLTIRRLITSVWTLPSDTADSSLRRILANRLLSIYERDMNL